jgi:hypothetical protein
MYSEYPLIPVRKCVHKHRNEERYSHDRKPRKMDVLVSTEAMLSEGHISEGCIETCSARTLFRHIRQFLARPFVESEKKKAQFRPK